MVSRGNIPAASQMTQKKFLQSMFFIPNSEANLVQSLLEKLPERYNDYPEYLVWAIVANNKALVEYLLDDHASLDHPPSSVTSGSAGNAEAEQLLQNYRKSPYIVLAACRGSAEIVELLLARGRSLSESGHVGYSRLKNNSVITNVLGAAVFHNKTELVERLLAKHSKAALGLELMVSEEKAIGSRGGVVKEYFGSTPLILATYRASPEMIELLLRQKANMKAVDHSGNTALHVAVSQNRIDAVQALLNCKVDVYARNAKGQTALTIAREKGFVEAEKILSERIDDSSQKIAEELINSLLNEESRKTSKKSKKKSKPAQPTQQAPIQPTPKAKEVQPPPIVEEVKQLTLVTLPPPKPETEKKEVKPKEEPKPEEKKLEKVKPTLNKAQRKQIKREEKLREKELAAGETKEAEEDKEKQKEKEKSPVPHVTVKDIVVGIPEELQASLKKRRKKKNPKDALLETLVVPKEPVQTKPTQPKPHPKETPEEQLARLKGEKKSLKKEIRQMRFNNEKTLKSLQQELSNTRLSLDKLSGRVSYDSLPREELESLATSLQETLAQVSAVLKH
jgi:hypothetical protein